MSQDQIECARAKDAKRKRESRKQPMPEDPEKNTTAKETALKQSYRKKLSEESKQRVRKEDRIRKAWDREYERRVDDGEEVGNVQADWVNQVRCLKGISKEERKQYNRERIWLWRNSKKQETIKPKLPRWQQIKNAKERYKHKKYMVGVNKAREDMDNEGKVMFNAEVVNKDDITLDGNSISIRGRNQLISLEEVRNSRNGKNYKQLLELLDSLEKNQEVEAKKVKG